MPASVNQLSPGCNTALGSVRTFTKANQGKLMIFGFLRKNNANRAIVERQYGILTTAARQKAFYRSANVPDTVMGRFEMLTVIMILYFRRSGKASEIVGEIAQEIVDAFFQDLDHSIRELGIGDQGVPKRMKKLASMFYGRVDSYGKALDARDLDALAAALKRNFRP
jgi:cytochrome b pre-mRNA-processing protein 3